MKSFLGIVQNENGVAIVMIPRDWYIKAELARSGSKSLAKAMR